VERRGPPETIPTRRPRDLEESYPPPRHRPPSHCNHPKKGRPIPGAPPLTALHAHGPLRLQWTGAAPSGGRDPAPPAPSVTTRSRRPAPRSRPSTPRPSTRTAPGGRGILPLLTAVDPSTPAKRPAGMDPTTVTATRAHRVGLETPNRVGGSPRPVGPVGAGTLRPARVTGSGSLLRPHPIVIPVKKALKTPV